MKFLLQTVWTITLSAFFIASATAQNGSISGVISDNSNNDVLIGATVKVDGSAFGASTDIDGSYTINNLTAGTYSISVSYLGYQTKTITEVIVKANETTRVDAFLSEEGAEEIETVVVTATAVRQSVSGLLVLQQKSAAIVTGISSDDIKKSPDRNTSDVLKRVSGTSVQDNKFVIVRGLGDRYNSTLINGMSLPSTEADRRAVSFDLFPANLLDNLIIYKTASPNLPGEFAGGIIQMNTREVPEKAFVTVSASSTYNSMSTFKPYMTHEGSSLDFLGAGANDAVRALPAGIGSSSEYSALLSDPSTRFAASQLFTNNWALQNKSSMLPSGSLQLSAGRRFGKLGLIGALTYNANNRITESELTDILEVSATNLKYRYFDKTYRQTNTVGAMLNAAYQLNDYNRITFNNLFNQNGEKTTVDRTGESFEPPFLLHDNSAQYRQARIYTSQLQGEHSTADGINKVKWGVSYSNVARRTPDYRRMRYLSSDNGETYFAPISGGAGTPDQAGKYFDEQNETLFSASADYTYTFRAFGSRNNVRAGLFLDNKNKDFTPRIFNYVINSEGNYNSSLGSLPLDQIFDRANFNEEGFRVYEFTQAVDAFEGQSTLTGAYLMTEIDPTDKFQIIGGLRVESLYQNLHNGLNKRTNLIDSLSQARVTDFLPSVNMIYSLNEKSKLRLSGSQTVARPNFRELAPFSFYDFNLNLSTQGNASLVRTRITNIDARYEIYPGENQMLAVTAFFKYFKNPIEQVVSDPGQSPRQYSYTNIASAINSGIELEFRRNLIGGLSTFGNFAYIYTRADISSIPATLAETSQLQGQSPYTANLGLSYFAEKLGITSTVLYNQIGKRIWRRGANGYLDIVENSRPVIDFQLAKKFGKGGEIKLTIGDLLAKEQIFYQDWDGNGKYNADKDVKILGIKPGFNVALTLGYKF